jgi:hypothetical protein
MPPRKRKSPSLIWFLLVDAATGQPYKGTTADAVSLLPESFIVQFRDAVKAKYADSHLQGVAPSDLLVYKNKEAFDKRNAEEGKEEPLDEESPVADLGRSKAEALYVAVPSSTSSPIKLLNTGELAGCYNHYQNIGQALETKEMVRCVSDELLSFANKNVRSENSKPFVFVEDSSGTGKTQLAFALMSALSKKHIKTLYLLCTPIGDNSQQIYRVYADISYVFQECIRRDLLEIRSENDLSCIALSRKSLYTYGFMYQLMEETLPEAVVYEPRRVNEVWSKLGNCSHYPVVILDEFPTIEGGNQNKLRLLRNSIRALKFGLLLMGTNSTAANLIEASEQSRDTHSFLWCSLYYRLPEVDVGAIGLQSSCAEWLQGLIRHSRPLFAVTALECIERYRDGSAIGMSVDEINSWLGDVALRIVSQKTIFDNKFGRHGQVGLFLNMSYHYTAAGKHNSPLIHRHFAHLEERFKDGQFRIHLMNDLTLENDTSAKWIPITKFPAPKDDVLLFLCLMGTRDFYPFRSESGKCISFRQAAEELEVLTRSRELRLVYDNLVQKTNDGMFLEAVLASCLCVASRSNGIGGVCLGAFICSVFSHTQMGDELKTYTLNIPRNAPASLYALLTSIIPNLAPPNQEWPDCVRTIPEGNFGHISRTPNDSRLDLRTDFGLTGESKDRKTLTLDIMKQIIARVPKESKVHVVFVRSLQNNYFTQASFASEFPDTKMSFCAVKAANDSELELCEIKGLPDIHSFDKDSTLVIFYLNESQ